MGVTGAWNRKKKGRPSGAELPASIGVIGDVLGGSQSLFGSNIIGMTQGRDLAG